MALLAGSYERFLFGYQLDGQVRAPILASSSSFVAAAAAALRSPAAHGSTLGAG
jgi:hypothetical protein